MSDDVPAMVHRLTEEGLLGKMALRYGSPDKTLLVSAGPPSHLASWSLVAAPAKKRVVIRQPSRDFLPAAPPHSPLNGDLRLQAETPRLRAEVEAWKHGSWYHSVTLHADNLEDLMIKLKPETSAAPFHVQHGAVFPERPFWCGALAYDLLQWTQPLRLQHPPEVGALLAVLWCVDGGLALDASNGRCTVFGNDVAWCERAEEALRHPLTPLQSPPLVQHRESVTHTDETHQDNIQAVRDGIVRGQVYQVNVGKHWRGEIDHPYNVFHRLLDINPAPYASYVEAEDLGFALASSSPESLLTCDGTIVSTAPIKGTCPQGRDIAESERLRQAMIEDEKERAEHRMLVDLMRNDLTHIARPGTVKVDRFDVEAYANVQHLVSHVSGTLQPTSTGASALQAVFPGGSITGCPRTVVCAVIDELEQMPRSFWTGSIGYIDVHSGQSAWNILIRTLEAHRKGGVWHASAGAGGGITIASDPVKEVAEAAWKGAALRLAAGWMRAEHAVLPTASLSIHPVNAPLFRPADNAESGAIQRLEQALSDPDSTGVLFIDNLDSFSMNIAHAMALTGHNVTVLEGRSPASQAWLDPVALNDLLERLQPSHLVLGPGPGTPDDCPLTLALAHHALAGQLDLPVLGICLGHQALAKADGWHIVPSPHGPVHGVPTVMIHDGQGLFEGSAVAETLLTRYNSLVALPTGNHGLRVNLTERDTGLNMGMHHPTLPIHTLQAHPESIGSPEGASLLRAFLEIESDG